MHSAIRLRIDHEHPLIVVNVFDMDYASGHDDYRTWWEAMPDDLKPYTALAYDEAATRVSSRNPKAFRECSEWCCENRVPFFMAETDPAVVGDAMRRYPCAVGTALHESRYGQVVEGLQALLPVLKEHGGLFFSTQITGWHFAHERGDMLRLLREYADHVVLCVKANGNTMRDTPGAYIGAAEMFSGLWLSGAMAQWGWHPETFLWYEFGYGKLFAPRPIWHPRFAKNNGKFDGITQALAFPENLMAQELLNAAIHGCTVFSGFEHASMTLQMNGHHTPLFRNCLLPILREIIGRRLIPSKEEVLRRTRIVSFQSHVPVYATTSAVVQNVGRYGLIPRLSPYTPAEVLRTFERVFDTQVAPGVLDECFAAEGTGTAFFARHGDRWYVWNPQENRDEAAHCELRLRRCPWPRLTCELGPHSLMILEERDDGIDIYLSNYRTEKDHLFGNDGAPRADLWRDGTDEPGVPDSYLEFLYRELIVAPARDKVLRTTALELPTAHGGGEPHVQAGGHEGLTWEGHWDAAAGAYRLQVAHNGVVRVRLSSRERIGATSSEGGIG